MTYSPRLDVTVSTWQPEGIKRVAAMHLPEVDGVRYVVSWQNHENSPIPTELMRGDIKIVRFGGSGLAANRNNAIKYSSAPIVLIADDDLKYTSEQLQAVINTFDQYKNVDLATFRYNGDNKHYPDESCPIRRDLPKGFSISAIEIAMRRNCFEKIKFDVRFGLGAERLRLGEDDKLLLDAVRANLNCRYFPITIATHHGPTTGYRPISDAGTVQASGCLIRGWYPLSWPLRIPLKAWRMWKSGSRFWFCFLNLIKGTGFNCRPVAV